MTTRVQSVSIQGADQDRALAFYTEVLGCELRTDIEVWPGARLVQVVPPGRAWALGARLHNGHAATTAVGETYYAWHAADSGEGGHLGGVRHCRGGHLYGMHLGSPRSSAPAGSVTASAPVARTVSPTEPPRWQPVRVITSADGADVWVTARGSDDLLCFSAARLASDPARALVATARVGEASVGPAFIA